MRVDGKLYKMYKQGAITESTVVVNLIQEAVNRTPAEIVKGMPSVWLWEVQRAVREGSKVVGGMELNSEKETKLYNDGLKVWTEWFGLPKLPTRHDDLIGREVIYKSGSGKEYVAVITAIPENPDHKCTDLPTVSLIFENNRGKYMKKGRVLPAAASSIKNQVWFPYSEGKYRWKDGKFIDEEDKDETN